MPSDFVISSGRKPKTYLQLRSRWAMQFYVYSLDCFRLCSWVRIQFLLWAQYILTVSLVPTLCVGNMTYFKESSFLIQSSFFLTNIIYRHVIYCQFTSYILSIKYNMFLEILDVLTHTHIFLIHQK